MKTAPINLPQTLMSAFVQTPLPGVYCDERGQPHRDVTLVDGPELAAVIERHKGTQGLDLESAVRAGTQYVGKYNSPITPVGQVRYVVEVDVPDPYSHGGRRMWQQVYGGDSLAAAAQVMVERKGSARRLEKITATGIYVGSEEPGYGCVENGFTREVLWEKKYSKRTKQIETLKIAPEVQALLKVK